MMCYINVMKWHVIHFNKTTDRQHDNMMNHTIQWYHIGAPQNMVPHRCTIEHGIIYVHHRTWYHIVTPYNMVSHRCTIEHGITQLHHITWYHIGGGILCHTDCITAGPSADEGWQDKMMSISSLQFISSWLSCSCLDFLLLVSPS